MANNFEQVGIEFVKCYYEFMQSNRENLCNFYRDDSCLSIEGSNVQGVQAIMSKIQNLSFKQVAYSVTTVDSQPVIGVDNGTAVTVSVMGLIKTDEDPAKSFCQTFLLRKLVDAYYISNESFRMILHNNAI